MSETVLRAQDRGRDGLAARPKQDPGACPVIRTERLVLRPHRRTDATAIAASLGIFAVSRMLLRVPQPFDRRDAEEWLDRQLQTATPDWTFAITGSEDAHIGLVSIELRHGLWHLGYWLAEPHWGRGLMSEAAQAALSRFRAILPDTEIRSGVIADNTASLKVQHKLGFRITGAKDVFSRARNSMVTHIDTMLAPGDRTAQARP